jgi:hypothetical protein
VAKVGVMTDNAERKVQEWAKKRNGDPLTAKDVVELVLAVDADGDARHEETLDLLDKHIADDKKRASVIAAELAEWRELQAEECESRHRVLFSEEMLELPKLIRHPRRHDDPENTDYRLAEPEQDPNLFEMLLGYKMLRRVVIVVSMALLVWGVSYWADSCSRAHYWGNEPPAIVASPQATEAP